MTAGALSWFYSKHTDFKFVRQSGNSTYSMSFINSIKEEVFQQDNTHPYTSVVTQRALQSVDMLLCPASSTDLSPIEQVWNIIG
ncbi:uncharacterized protein TNCV_4019581 [Trichonephila clavipes]|nr:uncharacterized protein TNCV_4019581 [Trichonephila clavipes]